jgi:DNA end-binding protein Ku
MLHKTDKSRLKQVLVCQMEDKVVPRSEIVKGFEYAKDLYVEIEDADIERVAPKTARTIEVLEFVKAQEVSAVYLESSYYVAPGAGAGEKAYALLYKALQTSGYVGVAKIAMNGREHVVIVRPGAHGLVLHTMFYADEIRQVEEFRTDCSNVQDAELSMALKLMKRMRARFEPAKYKDEYRENLMSMITERINIHSDVGKCINMQSEKAAIGESGADANGARVRYAAPVIDIMTALKRSLSRNGIKSAAASVESGSHVSGKPHTKAHRNTRGGSAGVQAVGRANGSRVRTQGATGDPLSNDGGRGAAPQGSRVPVVGTPN